MRVGITLTCAGRIETSARADPALETAAGGDGVQDSPVSGVEQKEGSVGWWEAILLGVATPECCLFAQTSRSVLFEAVHPRPSALAAGAIGTPRNQRLASAKQSEGQSILWSSLIIAVLFYCISLYLQDVPHDVRPRASVVAPTRLSTLRYSYIRYSYIRCYIIGQPMRPDADTSEMSGHAETDLELVLLCLRLPCSIKIRYNLSRKRSSAFAG